MLCYISFLSADSRQRERAHNGRGGRTKGRHRGGGLKEKIKVANYTAGV